MKVFLIGDIWEGSLEFYCQRAFKASGCEVRAFNTLPFTFGLSRSLISRLAARLTYSARILLLNQAIIKAIRRRMEPPDMALIVKGILFFPETLQTIKRLTGAVLCDWHNDDYFSPSVSSEYALACIPIYDYIFTSEKFNIPELKARGAKRVEYLSFGYDPELHRPGELSAGEYSRYCSDVVFIGSWRQVRAEILEALVDNGFKYKLVIWGTGWEKLKSSSPLRPYARFDVVYGENMPKAIWGSKICLAFVTRFDTGGTIHTMRTFEIPACGGFMLAERASGEYHEFFKEGTEMACFDGAQELKEKIEYYVNNEEQRIRIAKAGHRRLLENKYSYQDRVSEIIRACDSFA